MSDAFGRIRWRLAGWSVLVLCVIMLTLGGAIYVVLLRSLSNSVDRGLEASSQSAVTNVHEFFENGRMGPDGYRGGLFFVVADRQGRVLANPQDIALDDIPVDLLSTSGPQFRTVELPGDAVRIYARRIDDSGVTQGVLVVGQSLNPERATLGRLVLILLVGGGVGIVLSLIGAWFLAGRALVPIEASVRRQQEFVADASHELRTPLTILHAATDLLDQHVDEPLRANRALLDQVRSEIGRMERLTRDLLTLARSDRDGLRLAVGHVDMAVLASELVTRVGLLAAGQGVQVELHLEADGLVVDGDPDRLEQVGLILIDNSLKHTPPGGQVRVGVRRDGPNVVLEVIDSGEGIPRQHLTQVFDRFYRVDRARSRATGGAGLGLSIAETLVTAHRGRITISNQPGGGTRATVWLPLGSAQSSVADDAPAAVSAPSGSGTAGQRLSPR